MKSALVIPTCNACGKCWEQLLQSVEMQTFKPDLKLIVDSESIDNTIGFACKAGWITLSIRREKFNHGATRRKIVKLLHRKGFDTVILMTQDVILKRSDSLRELVDFMQKNSLAGCYGRQFSFRGNTLDQWQRNRCYPDKSTVKSLSDAQSDGLMTVFFSDAFAVWNIPVILKYGGFPDAEFGEDTLLAAKLLLNGEKTGYCAEAESIHEHQDSWSALWSRGCQIGRLHRRNSWLLREFGRPNLKTHSRKADPVPWNSLFSLGIKTAAYLSGRFLPLSGK